jgi:putative FmdB family regulatory protein
MPIYTYICKQCGFEFDIEQKITAEPLKECNKCDKGVLKKKLYPVGIAFKGPGFYSNDYKL